MRREVVALVSLGIALSVVLLLLTLIGFTPIGDLPTPLNTPFFCTSLPFYDPSQYVIAPTTYPRPTDPKLKFAQVMDLDPTIPNDSKAAVLVRRLNGDYEYSAYSTEEQKEAYLKSLHIGDCWVTSMPPACRMGHFPGEPPGRKPCTIPTPKAK